MIESRRSFGYGGLAKLNKHITACIYIIRNHKRVLADLERILRLISWLNSGARKHYVYVCTSYRQTGLITTIFSTCIFQLASIMLSIAKRSAHKVALSGARRTISVQVAHEKRCDSFPDGSYFTESPPRVTRGEESRRH